MSDHPPDTLFDSDVMRAEVQQIAELAFVFYRTEPGLMDDLDPVVGSTFAVRSPPRTTS